MLRGTGKRKQRVDVACDFCRQRKLGCDNAKPKCKNCAVYQKECTFTAKNNQPTSKRTAQVLDSSDPTQGSAFNNSGSQEQFHGPTSALFDEPRPKQVAAIYSESFVVKKSQLVAETARQRQLEIINFRARKLNFGGTDPDLGTKLLSNFWRLQIHTGTIVYRPYFMRDMACQGPYFSEFLLNAIYLTASRLRPGSENPLPVPEMCESGRPYHERLNEMIYNRDMRILFTSSIPTIQALLLLSDHLFAAYDKRSLSWQYLGIAIDMITDLGMHISSCSINSVEDQETRRRVFWTAFILDKIQGLYQGRLPRLRDMDTNVPTMFLDDFEELEAYDSVGPSESGATSHRVTTFEQLCKLSTITDHILCNIYAAKSPQRGLDYLLKASQELHSELKEWQDCLPAHLLFCFDAQGNLDTSKGFVALPHTLCLAQVPGPTT